LLDEFNNRADKVSRLQAKHGLDQFRAIYSCKECKKTSKKSPHHTAYTRALSARLAVYKFTNKGC